jgi:serine O-acetyltransferase
MKNQVFKKDLYRYYGESGETFKKRLFRPLELKYLYILRQAQLTKGVLSKYYKLKLRRLSLKTQIQISQNAKIDEGFYIGHLGRIIINKMCVIGKNVNIATGVTIGQENRGQRKGAPTIGDNVWIGTNAVIVGNVKIGSDVLIAPLSFVNFDVPDHSIVIGNPAKIIRRDNATEGYINNKI